MSSSNPVYGFADSRFFAKTDDGPLIHLCVKTWIKLAQNDLQHYCDTGRQQMQRFRDEDSQASLTLSALCRDGIQRGWDNRLHAEQVH